MIKLEELAGDIYGAIEHGEALYEKDMFDSLISDIQRLVDECHREFFKNQEEYGEETQAAQTEKVTNLEKEEPVAAHVASPAEPEAKAESMKILVVYAGTGCVGTVPVDVDRNEVNFEDFEVIQKTLRKSFKDDNLIITNMIKLPFKWEQKITTKNHSLVVFLFAKYSALKSDDILALKV